jgi:hypothetical protein
MSKRSFALLTLLLSFSAMAEEKLRLVQPKAANLTLAKLERTGDTYAKFNGQMWVSGTLVARWIAGTDNMNYKFPDYVLVPDTASVGKLPHFILKDPPYFLRYKVRAIDIQNGPAALRMAVGEEKVQRLINRKVSELKVTGSFLLEGYIVGVECDAPWARAAVVQTDLPEQIASAHLKVPEGC